MVPGGATTSDVARVAVQQVRLPRRRIARRPQVPAPRTLLVADGAELPDAERRAVCSRDRPGLEGRRVGAVLRPDRLPQLVVVAPRRDEQEVEALAAAVEDHKAEVALELELSRPRPAAERVAREL